MLVDLSAKGPVAKLADFAFGKQFETAVAPAASRRSDPFRDHFTPRERLRGGGQERPVSDLWSLAAVFYYGLTGQFPLDFQDRDPVEVILSEDAVPIRQRDASIPVGVAEVFDRALRTNTSHRYQAAAEMKAALEHSDGR